MMNLPIVLGRFCLVGCGKAGRVKRIHIVGRFGSGLKPDGGPGRVRRFCGYGRVVSFWSL